jgi:hypothetical protein
MMMTFNDLYNYILEDALGLVEEIQIEGIGVLKAKTDTGNSAHNVLHGIVQKENGNVTFQTIDDQVVSFPYEDEIKIHIGSGNKENRPVVRFNISINNQKYDGVPFSIADRSENEYKALLGEEFIKSNGGLVDVTKED